MLPLNIGLPKTLCRPSVDRCSEPCPQHWPQSRLLSPDPVLPQHWPSQDCQVFTLFLVSVMGWSWNSFTRWQAPSIPALVGVSPSGAVLGYSENHWGFRVLAPFIWKVKSTWKTPGKWKAPEKHVHPMHHQLHVHIYAPYTHTCTPCTHMHHMQSPITGIYLCTIYAYMHHQTCMCVDAPYTHTCTTSTLCTICITKHTCAPPNTTKN